MPLSGRPWGRRAAALVVVVTGAGLLAPDAGPVAAQPAAAREPGPARLADAGGGLRAADVALSGAARTVEAVDDFAMVGLTWRGTPREVRIRTRHDGRWSGWRDLELLRDGPDRSPRGVTGTDLAWVGEADAVRVDLDGPAPSGLTLTLLDPTGLPADVAARAVEPAVRTAARGLKPRLRSRASWGANPRWREMPARYNHTIKQVHVHHTVNSNSYSRGDVPGLLRGIYRYHTHNLGWSDIGYNFLVDRFGRTWVGRGGGARKPVQGAHTLGFNGTSTGVAVIGNFETTRPSKAVVGALARLSGWKLHGYRRDPQARIRVTSAGSDRFGRGRKVVLPVIDGHRDTNETACPGALLYERLPDVRRRAASWIARHR
ncbi:N-acetylmuramoyl-L-alanine amidase [Nocardioides sp. C4-1]|uniref:N-acetylmuramoyl-L-alanine amidase n=1 Tax=Nocardioides sp. C4-1 TaxID=3151851 RepID=UPI00326687A5